MRNSKISKAILIVSLAIFTFSLAGCPKFSRNRIKFTDPFEGNQISKYPGGGELGEKWTRDGQCEVLLKWLNKVKEEYPDLKIGDRGQVPSLAYYANLFRDSSFVPVFGESYLTMASSTRTNLWSNTFYHDGCIGVSRFRKYQADFDPYRGILENAFSKTSHGEKQIVAAVNGIHAEQNRLKETTSKVQDASMTIEALHELVAFARPTKGNLQSESQQQQDRSKANRRIPASSNSLFASLWPSEEEAFQKVLDQKLQKIAQELTTKSTKEVDSLTVSLESAQKIKNIYSPQSEEYTRLLPNSSESGVLKEALRSKLDSIVSALVKEMVQRLEAIPHTIGGLEQSSDWYSDFKKEFSEFRAASQLEAGESAFTQKRNAIFHETKPEFLKKLSTLDPSLGSLARADQLLASTFSLPPDRSLASHQEYSDLVVVRQAEILDKLLAPLSRQLGTIPLTLSGSSEILKWKHEFDLAYGPYKKFKGVQDVSINWAKKREEILRAAKAEFSRKLNALSLNQNGTDNASGMLADIFPNLEDANLPIYRDYKEITVSYQAAHYSEKHKVLTICVLKGKEVEGNLIGEDIYSRIAAYFFKHGVPTKDFIHQSNSPDSRVILFLKGEAQGVFSIDRISGASLPAARKFALTYKKELLKRVKIGELLLKMHSNDKFITESSELLDVAAPPQEFSENDRALTFLKESDIVVPPNATYEDMAKLVEHYVSAWKSLLSDNGAK